jgi:hypothetical protein
MSKTVTCPAVATLGSVVTSITDCPFEIGQIQKLIFYKRGNGLTTVASATSATVWTAHLAATGSKKSLVSPMLTLNIPPSEAREAGSGNEVLNGIPNNIGSNPVKVEGRIWEANQSVIAALKLVKDEYLDVMMVNESGQLIYKLSGATVKGFPIKSLWISDMATGSFADGTYNTFSFYLEPNWSDSARISTATTFLLDSVNS